MTTAPARLVAGADRALFLTHLGIGDFVYMRTYFAALTKARPGLVMDVWLDAYLPRWRVSIERRRALVSCLESSHLFRNIYETHSLAERDRSLRLARSESYPVVASLAYIERAPGFARLGRSIAPRALIAGVELPSRWHQIRTRMAYRTLDARILHDPSRIGHAHITDVYASFFERVFGVTVRHEARRPEVRVPHEWLGVARARFAEWGIDVDGPRDGPVTFVNPFATLRERCWSLEQVVELVRTLSADDPGRRFVINAAPGTAREVRSALAEAAIDNAVVFTAESDFFELPAVISYCDLAITVCTATSHLAAALSIPALVLKLHREPEWRPWDMTRAIIVHPPSPSHDVRAIRASTVVAALRGLR